MLAAALVVMFAACDNGTTGGGNSVPPLTGDIVPGSNLAAKLAWLRTNAESGKSYIIEINADETTRPILIAGSFDGSDNRYELNLSGAEFVDFAERPNITIGIRGIGANRAITSSSTAIFSLLSDVTLILDNNITVKGTGTSGPLVSVFQATLIMNPGSAITGSTSSGIQGNGVVVRSFNRPSTFVMNGGTISGFTSTGVWIDAGLTPLAGSSVSFTMNGGTISGNSSNGIYLGGKCTFTMNGGTITGNTADGNGGAISMFGTFIMNGGTISGNTAATFGGAIYCQSNPTYGEGIIDIRGEPSPAIPP